MNDPYDQLTEDDWESMLDAARLDEQAHPEDYTGTAGEEHFRDLLG